MIDFRISIAEITVEISALFASTKEFCKDYLTLASPDFSIEITAEDIEFERNRSKSTHANSGDDFSDEYLETLAVYRKIAEKLPFYNAFLFHASAIEIDGEALIFTAKSGTGKSTHTELYRKKFGSRVAVINDDKPIVLIKGDVPFVCGTPWSGKRGLNTNKIVPLKAICLLKQDENNFIQSISSDEAFIKLLTQAYRPSSAEGMSQFLSLFSKMLANTEIYQLHCNKSDEAATVSYNGIKG